MERFLTIVLTLSKYLICLLLSNLFLLSISTGISIISFIVCPQFLIIDKRLLLIRALGPSSTPFYHIHKMWKQLLYLNSS